MKNKIILGLIILTALTGCADASHVQACLEAGEHTYGFWGGTWHGMIMMPSFIGRFFFDDVAIYAVNNNGLWYDFGFVGGFFLMVRIIVFVFKQIRK